MHRMNVAAPPKRLVENYMAEIAKTYNVPFEPDPLVMMVRKRKCCCSFLELLSINDFILILQLSSSFVISVSHLISTFVVWSSFIYSGYFNSTSSIPLLLRGAPNYSIDTVSELTHRSATGSYK